MNYIDIADLDCIFLTYNEPKKEEFWVHVSNIIPWAKRVDGVKGSDAAHKAAAAASDTDRFILIDGDNLPASEFFDQQLELDESNEDCVFRWKAENEINGLQYGNGGISCWTKEFANNMRTHEASDGSDDTSVEFCFDPKYIAMHDTYSSTHPNQSAQQAWQAGFREGVKMCLNKGTKPTLKEFDQNIHKRNYDNLCIWMSVGADVEYGNYARYGAMQGTLFTMFGYNSQDWDYRNVQDFDKLDELYNELLIPDLTNEDELDVISQLLRQRLNLPVVNYNAAPSKFFKYHMAAQRHNKGLMVSELDVIRGIEGW